ncbi:MAG: response regulator, partial [Nitrospirota bacterium]
MLTAQRPKILVVDDNPRNAALIEGYIKPHYDVVKAGSGEECLLLLEKEDIALVILDIILPGINGYEVCQKIKANKATKKIPVMLIPALPTGQEKIRSLQAGAEDFISRPFSMNEVVARVRALLKIKGLYTDLEKTNENLASIISYTSGILKDFDPMTFNSKEFYKSLLGMILRKKPYEREKPVHVFLGKTDSDNIKGKIFSNGTEPVECIIPENFYARKVGTTRPHPGGLAEESNRDEAKNNDACGVIYSNHTDEESALKYQEHFHHAITEAVGMVVNFVAYISRHAVIIAFNYGRAVTLSDAQVLKGLSIHIPFFKSISGQIKETEDTLFYTITALSKAAELNDDNTGNHILRLNKYSMALARKLGLPEKFVHDIGLAAILEDRVDVDDPRVAQVGHEARLREEALSLALVEAQLVAQLLDGDAPVETLVEP